MIDLYIRSNYLLLYYSIYTFIDSTGHYNIHGGIFLLLTSINYKPTDRGVLILFYTMNNILINSIIIHVSTYNIAPLIAVGYLDSLRMLKMYAWDPSCQNTIIVSIQDVTGRPDKLWQLTSEKTLVLINDLKFFM